MKPSMDTVARNPQAAYYLIGRVFRDESGARMQHWAHYRPAAPGTTDKTGGTMSWMPFVRGAALLEHTDAADFARRMKGQAMRVVFGPDGTPEKIGSFVVKDMPTQAPAFAMHAEPEPEPVLFGEKEDL